MTESEAMLAARLIRAKKKAAMAGVSTWADGVSTWADIEFSAEGSGNEGEAYIRVPLGVAMDTLNFLRAQIDAELMKLGVSEDPTP